MKIRKQKRRARDASVVIQEIKDANKGLRECIEVMKERLKK